MTNDPEALRQLVILEAACRAKAERQRDALLMTLHGVLAALDQNKTFPADVEYVRTVASATLASVEGDK